MTFPIFTPARRASTEQILGQVLKNHFFLRTGNPTTKRKSHNPHHTTNGAGAQYFRSSSFIYYTVKNSLKAITQYASGATFKEVSGTVLKTVKVCLRLKLWNDSQTRSIPFSNARMCWSRKTNNSPSSATGSCLC